MRLPNLRRLNSKNYLIHPELGEIFIKTSPHRRHAAFPVKIEATGVVFSLKIHTRDINNPEKYLPLIDQNLEWAKERKIYWEQRLVPHTFEIGDSFMYLGREYPLAQGVKSFFDGEKFYVSTHSPALNRIELKKIYRSLAEAFIIPLCRQYAEKFNLTVGSIKISDTHGRWGSCSSKGDLRFSWVLIMCPELYIHQTICHELAHRIHMNHSPAFHKQLEEFFPQKLKKLDFWKYLPF